MECHLGVHSVPILDTSDSRRRTKLKSPHQNLSPRSQTEETTRGRVFAVEVVEPAVTQGLPVDRREGGGLLRYEGTDLRWLVLGLTRSSVKARRSTRT